MKRSKRQPNAMRLRILMIQTGVRSIELQKIFKVRRAAISMAISGERPNLHFRILEYVQSKSRKTA